MTKILITNDEGKRTNKLDLSQPLGCLLLKFILYRSFVIRHSCFVIF
jgi:hypothetical protein